MDGRTVSGDEVPASASGVVAAACVTDLGFPCHLACAACPRPAASARAYHQARRQLLAAAAAPGLEILRVGFFGGDPFALPRSFEALLVEVRAACERRHAELEGAVLSDGVAWRRDLVERFSDLGITRYQVSLDGPPAVHDARRPTLERRPSFDRIIRSLKYHRGDADVVVRVDSEVGEDAVAELAALLDQEGLLAGPHPVALLVASRAPYADQARDLLRLALTG